MTRTLIRTRPYGIDPFGEFDSLIRQTFGSTPAGGFHPAAEVTRDGDDAVVRLELPGVDVSRDVTVEVLDHRLVLRGERRDEHTEQEGDGGRTVREFRYGSFRRAFRLPGHVTAGDVSASYDAGVLTVRVAGVHASAPAQQIAISTAPAATVTPEPVESAEGDAEPKTTES